MKFLLRHLNCGLITDGTLTFDITSVATLILDLVLQEGRPLALLVQKSHHPLPGIILDHQLRYLPPDLTHPVSLIHNY